MVTAGTFRTALGGSEFRGGVGANVSTGAAGGRDFSMSIAMLVIGAVVSCFWCAGSCSSKMTDHPTKPMKATTITAIAYGQSTPTAWVSSILGVETWGADDDLLCLASGRRTAIGASGLGGGGGGGGGGGEMSAGVGMGGRRPLLLFSAGSVDITIESQMLSEPSEAARKEPRCVEEAELSRRC